MEPKSKHDFYFETVQKNKLVAPSFLASDFSCLADELTKIKEAGGDWVHLDIMDAHFVPNLTFGAPVIKKMRTRTDMFFDVHLMITDPLDYIEDYVKAGADLITFHVEANSDPLLTIKKIKSFGVRAGISLRPKTKLKDIEPYLDQLDLVLVMTVEPGFGGQSFMFDQVDKIDSLKELREKKEYSYLIEVDGGINSKTALECKNADVFVAGSYVFKAESYKEAISSLKF